MYAGTTDSGFTSAGTMCLRTHPEKRRYPFRVPSFHSKILIWQVGSDPFLPFSHKMNKRHRGTFMNFKTMRINEIKKSPSDSSSLIVDLRSPREYASGHLPSAINLPFDNWRDHPENLQSFCSRTLLLYCQYGNISLLASRILADAGFHIVNLYGGIHSYRGPRIHSQYFTNEPWLYLHFRLQ